MSTRKVLFPVLAIITFMFVACFGGDTLSVAQVNSPDPTATSVPIPTDEPTAALEPTVTAELELGLGGLEDVNLDELIQVVMSSPELSGCLRISMSILSIIENAEGYDPEVEMALILPCFSDDQIDSIFNGPSDLISPPEPYAVLEPIPTDAPVVRNHTG